MMHLIETKSDFIAKPLTTLSFVLDHPEAAFVTISDGEGNEYFCGRAAPLVSFQVGGRLGTHTICALGAARELLTRLSFQVDAQTSIDDGNGPFADLFRILHRSMFSHNATGTGAVRWKDKTHRYFVPWILDHVHTARGMQYFSEATREFVDLLALTQREDGMIWSQVEPQPQPGFFDTRDENRGYYTRRHGGLRFMRQPVENHCEYNFVDAVYLAWKSSGDDAWMKSLLPHACRALDYTRNSPVRWSKKFGLLKRGYTIDSWDFQVEDEHTVHFPIGTEMCIDEEKTKFGVFFGDNTGYAQACRLLARMLAHAGDAEAVKTYEERAREIGERLNTVSWNGRFYQHRVEEDSEIKRRLGVDEKAQIAMSNAYSLNREIPHDQCLAILETYRELLRKGPPGSPGEWYAIYPPFERGFGNDGKKWQYMNGGVHGHAGGELARGAFSHGHESYGVDILLRLRRLAQAAGDRVRFAYTGAHPLDSVAQNFIPIDLHRVANMSLLNNGENSVRGWMNDLRPGNDLSQLPTGLRTLAGVPYQIGPALHRDGRVVAAVSRQPGWQDEITVAVGRKANALYLLHTASAKGAAGIGGSVTLVYKDSTEHTEYLVKRRHFDGWWFPELNQKDAGIAWEGPNEVCTRVGLSWACLANPHPEKIIQAVVFRASLDGSIYILAGLTLADRMPHRPNELVSNGGPDNWAGGTCMAALIEGLAGVEDASTAMKRIQLSPRWAATESQNVNVTVRYPASRGYVSYRYTHHPDERAFQLTVTGGGESAALRLLLPAEVETVCKVLVDGEPQSIAVECMEQSRYLCVSLDSLIKPRVIRIFY